MPNYYEPLKLNFGTAADDIRKQDRITEASIRKYERLKRVSDYAVKSTKVYQDTWAGQLGLDPNGYTANAINVAASIYNGGSNLAQNIGSSLETTGDTLHEWGIDDPTKAAYNRYRTGQATEEDVALLGRKGAIQPTMLDEIEVLDAKRKIRDFDRQASDKSYTVDRTNQRILTNQLSEDFKEAKNIYYGNQYSAWDKLKAAAGLATDTVDNILSNPLAATEITAEQAPRIAMAATSGPLSPALLGLEGLGEAGRQVDEGVKNLKVEKGEHYIPTSNELGESALWALGGAALDYGADTLVSRMLKDAVKGTTKTAVKEVAKEATKELTKEEAKAGLLKAFGRGLANNRITKAGQEMAEAFGSEAVTGGLQAITEAEATYQPWTGEDVYKGAILEGAGGLGMAGVPSAARTLISGTGEPKDPNQKGFFGTLADKTRQAKATIKQTSSNPNQKKTFKIRDEEIDYTLPKGVKSDEAITDYLDSSNKKYNLDTAINLALNKHLDTETSIEEKSADYEALQEARDLAVDSLYTDSDNAFDILQNPDSTLEEKTQAELILRNNLSLKYNDALPKSKDEITDILFDLEEEKFKDFDNKLYGLKNKIQTQTLDSLKDNEQDLASQAATKATPETKESTVRAARIISNVAENNPWDIELSPEQLRAVADNIDNGLGDVQRQTLRDFAEVREAYVKAQNLEGVRADIRHGNAEQGFRGINEYTDLVTEALNTGNKGKTQSLLSQLDRWAKYQRSKADTLTQALEQVNAGGDSSIQVARDKSGNWSIFNSETIKNSTGRAFSINKNTPNLVDAVSNEADALEKMYSFLNSQATKRFGSTPRTSQNAQDSIKTTETGNLSSAPIKSNTSSSKASDTSQVSKIEDIKAGSASSVVVLNSTSSQEDSNKSSNNNIKDSSKRTPISYPSTSNPNSSTQNTGTRESPRARTNQAIKTAAQDFRDFITQNKLSGVTLENFSEAKEGNNKLPTPFLKFNNMSLSLKKIKENLDKGNIDKGTASNLEKLLSKLNQHQRAIVAEYAKDLGLDKDILDTYANLDTGVAGHRTAFSTLRNKHNLFERLGFSKDPSIEDKKRIADFVISASKGLGVKDLTYSYVDSKTKEHKYATSKYFKEWQANYKGTSKTTSTADEANRAFEEANQPVTQEVSTPKPKTQRVTYDDSNPEGFEPLHVREAKQRKAEAQSDEETPEVDLETGEEVASDTKDKVTYDGMLGVYNADLETNPDEPDYNKVNKVRRYTKQVSHSADDPGLNKPLATIKNFGDKVDKGLASIKDFLSKDDLERLDNYKGVFRNFTKLRTALEDAFNSSLVSYYMKVDENGEVSGNFYSYGNDLLRDLIIPESLKEGNPRVEQNVSTAVAAAVYSWMLENYHSHTIHNEDTISGILGLAEGEFDSGLYSLFKNKGMPRSVLAAEIGKRAVKFLGIKPRDNNTPANIMNNLELSIGLHAIAGLVNTGWMTEDRISADAFKPYNVTLPGHATHLPLFRFKDFSDGRVVSPFNETGLDINKVIDANKGSDNIFSKGFGSVHREKTPPSFTPTENKQRTAQRSDRLIPPNLREIFNKKGQEKNYIDMDQYNFIKSMLAQEGGRNLVLKMMGAKDEKEINNLHTQLRDSALAKNKHLEQELDEYLEWIGMLEEQANKLGIDSIAEVPFYYDFSIWQNFRVGLANHYFNPQRSKFHRFSGYMEAWKAEVDLNNKEALQEFYSGVAEAFGLNLDKNKMTPEIEKLKGMLVNDADIKASVEAMKKQLQEEDLSIEEMKSIVNVASQYENQWTVAAIKALAQKQIAEESGATTFTTTLPAGMDGVNNGPILFHLASGIMALNDEASTENIHNFFNKGGFFFEGQSGINYNDYRSKDGNLDLYESITKYIDDHISNKVRDFSTPFDNENKRRQEKGRQPLTLHEIIKNSKRDTLDRTLNDSFKVFLGSFTDDQGKMTKDGRNFAKLMTQPITFGSSLYTVQRKLGRDFFEAVLNKLSKVASDEDSTDSDIDALVRNLNYIMVRSKNRGIEKHFIPLNVATKENILKYEFTPEQQNALMEAFSNTFGKYTREALEEGLVNLLNAYSNLNTMSNLSFSLFKPIYDLELAKYKEEVGIPKNSGGHFLQDLSPKQKQAFEKRIRDLFGIAPTVFSEEAHQKYGGIKLLKTEKTTTSTPEYLVKANPTNTDGGISHVSAVGSHFDYASLSVSYGSNAIHSTDSKIIAETMNIFSGLSNHDELVVSTLHRNEAAKEINRQTFLNMLKQNPHTNILKGVMKQFKDLNTYLEQLDDLGKYEIVQQLLNRTKSMRVDLGDKTAKYYRVPSVRVAISQQVMNAVVWAIKAEKTKLKIFNKMTHINQYAKEGGSYTLTEEDKELIKSRYSKNPLGIRFTNDLNRDVYNFFKSHPGFVKQIDTLIDYLAPFDAIEGSVYYEGSKDKGKLYMNSFDIGNPGSFKELLNDYKRPEVISFTKSPEYASSFFEEYYSYVSEEEMQGFTSKLRQANKARPSPKLERDIPILSKAPKEEASGPVQEPVQEKETPTTPSYTEVPLEQLGSFIASRFQGQKSEQANAGYMRNLYAKLHNALKNQGYKVIVVEKEEDFDKVANDYPAFRGVAKDTPGYTLNNEKVILLNAYVPGMDKISSFTEILIHEFTHALLEGKLLNSDNPTVKELTGLLDTVKQELGTIQDDGSIEAEMTRDVHEFVAYGLTNPDAISLLKGINVGEDSFLSALRKFVDTITQGIIKAILGTDDTASKTKSAYAKLLYHSLELIEQAGNTQNTSSVVRSAKVISDIENGTKEALERFNNISIMDTFNRLDKGNRAISDGFKEHLSTTLENITNIAFNLSGTPNPEQLAKMPKTILESLESYAQTGEKPFQSEAIKAGLPLSNQESYAIEMIEATLNHILQTNDRAKASIAKQELMALWREARKRLNPENFYEGDWAQATNTEKEAAQDLYDFLFKVEPNANPMGYITRFTALALGSEKINKVLNIPSEIKTETKEEKTIRDHLKDAFNKFLAWVTNIATGTYAGQSYSEKVDKLAMTLAKIQHSYKNPDVVDVAENIVERFQNSGNAFIKKTKDKVLSLLPENTNSSNGSIGSMIKSLAVHTGRYLLDEKELGRAAEALETARADYFKGLQNTVSKLITYIKGQPWNIQRLLILGKQVQKEVVETKATISKQVLEQFEDEGKYLTEKESRAISYVGLRSGMHFLLDHYDLNQLERLVSSRTYLDNEIEKVLNTLEKTIGNKRLFNFYKAQAEELGYLTQHEGNSINAHQLLNAKAIAHFAGVQDIAFAQSKEPSQEVIDASEKILETLITLYSLQKADTNLRLSMAFVMSKERRREANAEGEQMNGILATLRMARMLHEDAKKNLFADNEMSMVHGHISEVMNQSTVFEVTSDPERKKMLEIEGYVKVADNIKQDPIVKRHHAGDTTAMYILKNAGLNQYVSGAMSLNDLHSKGDTLLKGDRLDGVKYSEKKFIQQIRTAKRAEMNKLFSNNPPKRSELRKDDVEYQIPILSADGSNVTNYRDMMQSRTKDKYFERDNDFASILGATGASTVNKLGSEQQNKMVLDALQEAYQEDLTKPMSKFITIGLNSDDPEIKEIYQRLPMGTKLYIREKWGEDAFKIPADAVDILLGYRSPSIADMLENKEHRNAVKAFIGNSIELAYMKYYRHKHPDASVEELEAYAKRAARHIRIGEDWIATGVAMAKQNIVIKTGSVLVGNIWSNNLLLRMYGVPLVDIYKDQLIAFRAIKQYQKDHMKLMKLRNELAAGFSNKSTKSLQAEITTLEQAIENNPIYPLIKEGLFSTIAEDLGDSKAQYTTKEKVENAISEWTDKYIPEPLRVVGKELYMTEGTFMFDLLNEATMYSDLVAKYALYKYNTTKKGLTHEEAIFESVEAFVNYDIPLPKELQYLDKMGLVMFIKYGLSMQRVLWRLMHRNPMQVLTVLAINNLLNGPASAMDSFILNRLGNPLEKSILALPESVADIYSINALQGFIK